MLMNQTPWVLTLGLLLTLMTTVWAEEPKVAGESVVRSEIPPLPQSARLAFEEDWSTGQIDPEKWYRLRKKWGDGNHGVVPENVFLTEDEVQGKRRNVLVCRAHGDQYEGPIIGLWGKRERVGGVIVSKPFFASGRFQVTMKVGDTENDAQGPTHPAHPSGSVPAIWTYAYRWVEGDPEAKDRFTPKNRLYNPHMPAYGLAANEYWSELDFPEYGKDGKFHEAMYNTFCQNRHHPTMNDMQGADDGRYHTYTTDWRTTLKKLPGVRDSQVVEHLGYHWIRDEEVPFADYLGNPLKKHGPDDYSVYWGAQATHWIDGKKVAQNELFVPAMAAQLNLGIWLPDWAGPADWKTSKVSFADVKVWQFDDPGDVRGILVDDLKDSFDQEGNEVR